MRTLYEIDADILSCIDEETGEIDEERLNGLSVERDKKVEHVALYLLDTKNEIEAYKAEEQRFKAKRKNAEIADEVGCADQTIRTLIARLKQRKDIDIQHNGDGQRCITVLKEPGTEMTQPDGMPYFKREMYRAIAEQYFIDFVEAGSYSERLEIGRMICRILENI